LKPSCAASTSTSACVARTAARASSCPQRPSHLCRCPCCICGDHREKQDALPISVSRFWRWPTPGMRSALWHASRDPRIRSRSFPRFAIVLSPRKRSPAQHRSTSSSRQSIDSRTRSLTIPITTVDSAVQSNEVYLTLCSTVPSLQLHLGVR